MNTNDAEKLNGPTEANDAAGGDCAGTTGSAPVLFPRNPERDEKGNAVLYPGMPRFEGVAGLFTLEAGEVVILAPTMEALDAHVRRMRVTDELARERCIITEARRVPNAASETRGHVAPNTEGGNEPRCL